MAKYRLDADHSSTDDAPNRLNLRLTNTGDTPVANFALAFTSLVRIKLGSPIINGQMIEQLANYQVIAPPKGLVLAPGETWHCYADNLSHTVNHYSYGPKSVAVRLADGTIEPVDFAPLTHNGEAGEPMLTPPARKSLPAGAAPISVIPQPARVEISGQLANLPACLSFGAGSSAAELAFSHVSSLARRLFPGESLFGDGGLPVRVETSEALEDEGYVIDFDQSAISVRAGNVTGFTYAFVTLGQILRGARLHPEDFSFPAAGTIADTPRFGWRGAHLDVARQVYSVDEIAAFIDTMAWNKLNRFHIHLNDDEGWRIDVPGYPSLTEKGASRGVGMAVPPLFGSSFEHPEGIVYSPSDIRMLVAQGNELGIIIVPEIDVPGHCYVVLNTVPGLNDPGENAIYRSVQYYPNNALNPAVEATYTFMEAVIRQIAELFPSPWIHIGGDEVSDQAWSGSPLANALKAEHGWEGTFELQSYFLKRVQAIVRELGRKTGAWEEAAFGSGVDNTDSYLVVWTKSEPGRALADQGYDVVMAPAEHVYFDMAQSDEWWDPGAAWAGTVSVKTCYDFDPGHDWTDEARKHLIGVQSCLWSENLNDKRLFDHLMYPRLSALAETAWSPRAAKNYDRFLAIQSLMPVTGKR